MRHFDFLAPADADRLFAVPPRAFDRSSSPSTLALALGATFYSPGTRPHLADDAHRAASIGVTSQVWCLEDSIAHEDVPRAEASVVEQLQVLHERGPSAHLPLLFVRVRSPKQLLRLVERAGPAAAQLTGFVLPKIAPDDSGEAFLAALPAASDLAGVRLYGMPVLEHPDLAWLETRAEHLRGMRTLFDAHREHLLAVRVGGTDLCGLFGLRRDAETTIWEVAVVRDALADVLNVFARLGDYTCTGPVWEHFSGSDRLFRPPLRQTPFEGRSRLRAALLRTGADELLREVSLDRTNGFCGKTVIHPTHVTIVNALSAVSREEHDDALAVLAGRDRGGVAPSSAGNKMNETGPHGLWAEQVLARAGVFGVLADADAVLELIDLGRQVAKAAYGPSVPAAIVP